MTVREIAEKLNNCGNGNCIGCKHLKGNVAYPYCKNELVKDMGQEIATIGNKQKADAGYQE